MEANEAYKSLGEIERWLPIRNHIFNMFNISETSARNLAKSYRDESMLTEFQYLGLLTEINYYKCKSVEHKLTLAGDTELTDFTGEINGEHCRIQVSNNKEIKIKDKIKFERIPTPLPYYIVSPKNDAESSCEYDEIKITQLPQPVSEPVSQQTVSEPTPQEEPLAEELDEDAVEKSTNSFSSIEILVGIEGRSDRGNNEFFTELHHLSYDLNLQRATLIDSQEGLGFPSRLVLRDRYQEDLHDLGPEYVGEVCPGVEHAKRTLNWYNSTREHFTPLVYAEIGYMQDPEHYKSKIIALEIVYSAFELGEITELPFDEENRDDSVNLAFRYGWRK